MNRLVSISLLSMLLIVSAGQKVMAQDVAVSYQTFYDNLAPYGQWVYDPQYGNVWVPNEGGDFRPYGSRGHWVMTDYGNTWVSEDPWGWACYHYGRWTYDPYYGWVWVPGYEWAPAWVSWRYGGGACGWAPLGPGVTIGVSYYCPDSWWIFVGPEYMYRDNCYSYWRGPRYNTTYIHQTTIINNYYEDHGTHVRYNYGPRRDAIERDTHQPVQVYHVSQTSRPGAPSVSGNRVSIYRPAVNRETANTARPANVMQAPRQIGKPQAATTVSAEHQAPFRQEVQRNAPNNARPGNQTQPPARNNEQAQPPIRNDRPVPPTERAQPQHEQPMPPVRQQNDRPQPQHVQPMPPVREQQQNERPQPPREQPMPPVRQQNDRPQPQHFNNQPPQRSEPAPQPRPMPQPQQQQPRPMPQQQQPRPTPQPQAPRPQPAPQREAPHEAPREQGGRR